MAEKYPPRPWTCEVGDLDDEDFRVIRAGDGRPLAYVAKELSPVVQDDVARLIIEAPNLLAATRAVFFAQSADGAPLWGWDQWKRWRHEVGPRLAELWMGWV